MKKIINDPENFEREMLEGICAAYGDKVGLLEDDPKVLVSKYPVRDGKVGIVTLGGSGHLPVFLGYVGQGMLDACAVGNVFASPSAASSRPMQLSMEALTHTTPCPPSRQSEPSTRIYLSRIR